MSRFIRSAFRALAIGLILVSGHTLVAAAPAADRAIPPAPADGILQQEFAAAGVAMREQLAHTAAGDSIGAALAARDVQAHRLRYLDLKRAQAREVDALHATSSVTERTNPFAPDARIEWPSKAGGSAPPGAPSVVSVSTPAAWDLYAAPATWSPGVTEKRGSPSPPGQQKASGHSWGMYGQSLPGTMLRSGASMTTAAQRPEDSAEEREPPTRPFFVYRSSEGGGGKVSDRRQPRESALGSMR